MNGQLHIFVLIDALGAACRPAQRFLTQELPHRQALKTVLGFSSGAVPTILTGQPPATTGHWNLFYLDPEGSPFKWMRWINFVPPAAVNHRVSRKLLTEAGRRLLGLGPLFDCAVPPRQLRWFNWVEKRNIYQPGGIGGAASIFDRLHAEGTPYCAYTYHEMSDERILAQAQSDLRARKANFFFLYLCEMDAFLHMHCRDEAAVGERLRTYETSLRSLYQLGLAIDPGMRFTVFSDHGMTPIEHRVDLGAVIDGLGLRAEWDYLAVYDSTMARFWFFNERARSLILAALEQQSCGQVLAEEELRREGTWFDDQRFGEAVFLLHPGWLVAKSGFNSGGWNPSGMHGYHPNDVHSDAIFLSNRPPERPLRGIADIYPCLEAGGRRARG